MQRAPVPALEMEGLEKSFGSVRALAGVSLSARSGEIVGIVGHNGSGKSTLVKVLAGFHRPDHGRIRLHGREVSLPMPFSMLSANGIALVHQDLGLAVSCTVLENFLVNRYKAGRLGRIRWARERRRVAVALQRVGLDVPLDLPVEKLSPVERTLLVVARALSDLERYPEGGVLVLDEPTSYLTRDGVERLFGEVRKLAASGVAVLFVSHRLDEVLDVATRVAVFRDGQLVADRPRESVDEATVLELMFGQTLEWHRQATSRSSETAALTVEGLVSRRVRGVSFELRGGEILGLAGLAGMGQDEVLAALFGSVRVRGGTVKASGETWDAASMTPTRAVERGLVFLPGDRLGASGIGHISVRENLAAPVIRRFFRRGYLHREAEASHARVLLESYAVKPANPGAPLTALSGGNQQKALLAKWVQVSPAVLLLQEPTQGVDVGARVELFDRIREVAANGTSVLISSCEYRDLATICDRVLVLWEGEIVAELGREELTEEEIVNHCYTARSVVSAPGGTGHVGAAGEPGSNGTEGISGAVSVERRWN